MVDVRVAVSATVRGVIHLLTVHRVVHCCVLRGFNWRAGTFRRLRRVIVLMTIVVMAMVHGPLRVLFLRLMSLHVIVFGMMLIRMNLARCASLRISIHSISIHLFAPVLTRLWSRRNHRNQRMLRHAHPYGSTSGWPS
jgi:hypothetical protein